MIDKTYVISGHYRLHISLYMCKLYFTIAILFYFYNNIGITLMD